MPAFPTGSPRSPLLTVRGLFSTAIALGILAGLTATLLGFAGDAHWSLDLFSHFRVQYLIGAVVLLSLALVMGLWRCAGFAGLGLLLNAAFVLPLYRAPETLAPVGGPLLKVLYANVLTSNDHYDELIALVHKEQPDIIALLEFSDDWQAALDEPLSAWHHRESRPRYDNFGLAIYSRLPFSNTSWPVLTPTGSASFFSTLLWDGQEIPFMLVHPYPPIRRYASKTSRAQVRELCQRAEVSDERALLVGDLNATPWCQTYRQLDATQLVDARQGFGILPTWPSRLPALLRIPIDAVMVGPRWSVQDLRVGPHFGSDHRPLLFDLSLNGPPRNPDTREARKNP